MAGKNCRHVRQALHLSEFRRALKNRALFACEVRRPLLPSRSLFPLDPRSILDLGR